MLVGFNQVGNLIEVAVEILPSAEDEEEDELNFYHAMKATPQWRNQYERKGRG